MVSALFFSQLVLSALVWLCVMLQWVVYLLAADNCPPPGGSVQGQGCQYGLDPIPRCVRSGSQAPLHPYHSPALPTTQPGVRMEHASASLGLIRGSETASLGWWHPVFVSQVMQQQHRELPRCSCLLWTRSTGAEGLA